MASDERRPIPRLADVSCLFVPRLAELFACSAPRGVACVSLAPDELKMSSFSLAILWLSDSLVMLAIVLPITGHNSLITQLLVPSEPISAQA